MGKAREERGRRLHPRLLGSLRPGRDKHTRERGGVMRECTSGGSGRCIQRTDAIRGSEALQGGAFLVARREMRLEELLDREQRGLVAWTEPEAQGRVDGLLRHRHRLRFRWG